MTISDFKSFYNEHEAFVRKSLYYIIKNTGFVDDVVQEVFVKVWKKQNSFKEQANVRTWLYRITVNCALDHLRKNKKRLANTNLEDLPELPSEESNSLHMRQLIKLAIDQLDDKSKPLFVLYYINEVPQANIALALKVPIGTVKSRLNKARTIVTDYLKTQGVNYES